MAGSIEMLERRIDGLRAQVRRAVMRGDRERARELRRELREAEHAWEDALARVADTAASGAAPSGTRASWSAGPAVPEAALPGGRGAVRPAERLLPLREQVHQALTLLGVPAALRMITTVHEAFFESGTVAGARLTSVRRDEERSFRSAPFARPYYLCAALTADLLAPARGLLAVSTWPMERRVIGPLSPRVDYLSAAIAVAESVQRIAAPSAAASRLLWRFAVNIPGVPASGGPVDPGAVADAARAELAVHADADAATRRAAAARARHQLDDVGQLFGSRLRALPHAAGGA